MYLMFYKSLMLIAYRLTLGVSEDFPCDVVSAFTLAKSSSEGTGGLCSSDIKVGCS